MKKNILYPIFIILFSLSFATQAKTITTKYSLEFLVDYVLKSKGYASNPAIAMPTLHYESKTSLKEFQDAIESQWGFRPKMFSNAFSIKTNQIFVTDDAAYYIKHGRCIDDSVVHEIVHYYQTKYRQWDINDESLEWDAIDVQSEFRSKHCPIK
jgi:hypothetical protein